MAKVLAKTPPLRLLREKANLTMAEAAEKLSAEAGRTISSDYLNLLELRGTSMYLYIRAMAKVYGCDPDEVYQAATKVE